MAEYDIDELTTSLSEDQMFEQFLSIAESLGLPARTWRKGGAMRVILRILARVYAAFTIIMVLFVGSGFLETATGGWLTRLAWYVYGVRRRESTFAREQLLIKNDGGGLYEDVQPGQWIAYSPTTKKRYRNVETFTLGPQTSIFVMFEAFEVGASSSAPPGTIIELETHFDQVSVINLKTFVGLDPEPDPDLRQACKDKIGALSVRGPRGAYRWAVREAKRLDGTPVNINRVQISTSSSKGIVNVVVASPSGAPLAEDLTSISESIERLARPDAVRVNLSGATEVVIPRQLTIYARRTEGVSADDIRALVEAAFVREQSRLPIGGDPKPPLTQGKVWAGWIVGIAKAAHESIYEVDGEGLDTSMTTTQVAQLQITAPTVRISEVQTPS